MKSPLATPIPEPSTIPDPPPASSGEALENAAACPRLLGSAEVRNLTGLKPTKMWALQKEGKFPRPVKQGRLCYWYEQEVADYMRGLPRA